MSKSTETKPHVRSPKRPARAEDLMSRNPVTIRDTAPIAAALVLLIDTGFSAAPVIDEVERPVGVISRTDIVVYDRRKLEPPPGVRRPCPVACDTGRPPRVSDLMTPEVFSVAPETPAAEVSAEMVRRNVHRLFVADRAGHLVGVISTLDLLRFYCS